MTPAGPSGRAARWRSAIVPCVLSSSIAFVLVGSTTADESAPAGEPELAFRTDRAPVPLVLDTIGAVLGLDVVLDAQPVALVSGSIQGTLAEALTELQAIEPLVFDVHEGVLNVRPASASIDARLANDVSATLPMSAILSLDSALPANRIRSDASGTRVSGHPEFVQRTVQGLRALLSMRGLSVVDTQTSSERDAAALNDSGGPPGDPLSGLEAIPGFNTL